MTKPFHPHLFRPATQADIPAIASMTQLADSGLTTVPKTLADVENYVENSLAALSGNKEGNRVLFVLEVDGIIAGISGIIANLGLERPFYSFSRSRHSRRSTVPDVSINYETLQLTTAFDGYTELATLFVAPKARGMGLGRLLSFGRLAFIAQNKELFENRLMADIRGWADDDGKFPFWEDFVSKFIPVDFDVADRQSASDGRFIVELLPAIPVLLNLLPQSVSNVIGRPNAHSQTAFNLLTSIGFKKTEHCDVFDGGPSVACEIEDTLIARTLRPVQSLTCVNATSPVLVTKGTGVDFRAMVAPGDMDTASVDQTAIAPLHPENTTQLRMADIGSRPFNTSVSSTQA